MNPPSLAVAPIYVSDRTSEIVLGVPWRNVRRFCEEHNVPITHIGRRPVVAVADITAALAGETTAPSPTSDAELIRLAACGRSR